MMNVKFPTLCFSLFSGHLKSVQPILLPNLLAMNLDDRKAFSTKHFRFLNPDLMSIMLKCFQNKDKLDELDWNATKENANNNKVCKFCGDATKSSSVTSFNKVLNADHIMSKNTKPCLLCGFPLVDCTLENSTHIDVHDMIPEPSYWEETLEKLNKDGQIFQTPTTTIRLKK